MVMLLVFTFMLAAALFPGISAPVTKRAVEICLFSVIPSLFPFFVLNHILLKSGAITDFCRRRLKITAGLFRLPPEASAAIILGFLSGYPAGIKVAGELYDQNLLTKSQYRRLTAFCGNAGPAFITGAVGVGMLSSQMAGIYLLLVHIITAVAIGIISGILSKDHTPKTDARTKPRTQKPTFRLFADGIYDSLHSVAVICGFVIFFGFLSSYLLKIPGNAGIVAVCLTEMTNGSSLLSCLKAPAELKLSLICGTIGWGGLCVHAQSLCFLKEKRCYLAGKLAHGVLSFIVSYSLLLLIQKLYGNLGI